MANILCMILIDLNFLGNIKLLQFNYQYLIVLISFYLNLGVNLHCVL